MMIHTSNLDITYLDLRVTDNLISKALALSEVAQIAKAEVRLREYLFKKWEIRSIQAIKKAVLLTRQNKKANLIIKEINKIMSSWAKDVEKTFREEFSSIYKLARIAGWKKATGQTKASLSYTAPEKIEYEITKAKGDKTFFELLPSFDLIDEKTIQALEDSHLFWIGDHYDKNVSDTISKVVRDIIEEYGQNNQLAAEMMLEELTFALSYITDLPKGFSGTVMQYLDGLVANAATTGRAHGQLRSFGDIGITYYVITNPVDERTCQRCSHLDGKEFSVQDGYSQMSSELSATSPDEIKKIHPWLTYKQILEISPKPGYISGQAGKRDSAKLVSNGVMLPPFHYKCRCTVDISHSSFSYDDLVPLEPFPF